jgi:hypothetical protein
MSLIMNYRYSNNVIYLLAVLSRKGQCVILAEMSKGQNKVNIENSGEQLLKW